MVTGNAGSACHVCPAMCKCDRDLSRVCVTDAEEGGSLQCPPLILLWASEGTPHSPEGRRDSGERESIQGWLQRGLKRRSSLAGLASMRNHAACQVAVGIVWSLPLSLSSLLREDTFKVTVPLREPSPWSLGLVVLKAARIRPAL